MLTARRRSNGCWRCLQVPWGSATQSQTTHSSRAEMLKHARNYARIHRMYNLPYQSEPGSDMAKVAYTTLLSYVSPSSL